MAIESEPQMKIQCEACGAEHEADVKGPTLLKDALPQGWRPRRIDSRVYILCDVCGNLRQFVGGLSPYLRDRLGLVGAQFEIETPEYTEIPDDWFDHCRGTPMKRCKPTE
ncbi:MAG: hypothetical protein H6875_05135 [Hyphomicrobiaceae bacterium]|nr:hypothetical protein [Hyphomicrobiaceae bacterium]